MSITLDKLTKLPDAPGVYLFKQGRRVLYVGKATSLKSRVRSYLSDTAVESRGPKILKLIQEATRVDYEETDTVLEALIREAALIKKHQPPYNAKEKSDKSFNVVVITDEAFPRVFVMRERELLVTRDVKLRASYGPFPHSTQLSEALKIIRKIFPYRGKTDAPVAQGRKDGRTKGHYASRLYEEIGLSPRGGGADDPQAYARTIKQLQMFFEGKKTKLVQELEREMKRAARAREFEVASEMKRRIFALKHINDIALMRRTNHGAHDAMRIEAYDVAHTSGTNVVGVMAVVVGDEIAKNEYRMFTIKGDGGERLVNDTAALSEMLERRFGHPEWAYPKLIVVDGSTAQLNAAKRVLTELGIEIPVVSVVKDDRHRPLRIMGDAKRAVEHGHAILLANAEAHRFAIRYHRRRRAKIL